MLKTRYTYSVGEDEEYVFIVELGKKNLTSTLIIDKKSRILFVFQDKEYLHLFPGLKNQLAHITLQCQ